MAKNNIDLSKRKYMIGGIACLVVLIYIIQLFGLQIVKGEYKDYADNNAFFNRTLYPARGVIYDRNEQMLVYNQPTYDIVYIPREVEAFDTLDFCNTLDITREQFDAQLKDIKDKRKNPGYSTYTQQTFFTQLDIKKSSLFQEKLYKFPGFFLQHRTIRQYTYPNAGNLIGYVAEVDREQIRKDRYYKQGDYIGKTGIESFYENHLRGEKGKEILLRDARGRIQGNYENGTHDIAPSSGRNLTLSIDMELQAYGEKLMHNKTGAIVMIEPKTGEILCLVAAPTYDPSLLLGRDFSKNYKELESNPLKPLFNEAIQGKHPPGSTFKTAQGLIFLEEGAITTNSAYPCNYGYPAGGGKPACHGHPTPISIVPALATSCNAYFCYGLSAMLNNRQKYKTTVDGVNIWRDYLVEMGFGYRLGVDISGESRGFIPNGKYYSQFHSNLSASNIISVSIGQGEIAITPLQGANLAATIANRGYFYTPHIVKGIQDTILDKRYIEKHVVNIKKEHYETIVDGMALAVSGGIGTCRRASLAPQIEVCGKTGTAQNPHGDDHSIFMGFAPKDDPKVAIYVIVKNAGFGATFGVPIGKLMLEKYLEGGIRPEDEFLERQMMTISTIPRKYIDWNKYEINVSEN